MSAPVHPLSPLLRAACVICDARATWQVGLRHRACGSHLGFVLSHLHRLGLGLPYQRRVS